MSDPRRSSVTPSQPGDTMGAARIARMIRVDHAGEYGAERIYAGQLAVLGHTETGEILRHMKDQETVHKDAFSAMISVRRVRPTALLPIWHVAGFALGALTAAMGKRAAMACTVAVEEAIDEHYAAQAASFAEDEEPELRATIEKFRLEELEHRDIGLANQAELASGYRVMAWVIKAGCKVAIAASEIV